MKINLKSILQTILSELYRRIIYTSSMIRFIKLVLVINTVLLLAACSTSSQRLSIAEDKTPIDKINIKLQKYINALYSKDAAERAGAAYNIGKSAKLAGNTVPYLIALLDDSEVAVITRYVGKNYSSTTTTTTANESVKALGKIGRAAVKPLLAELRNPNSSVVVMAIKTLGLIKDNETIKPLVAFLTNKDKRVRLEAANSLSRFKNPWIAEYLLKTLKNNDPAIRSTALYALGKLKSPVAIPDLLTIINDSDVSIRSQVLYVLSHFKDERIIQPLIEQEKIARDRTSDIDYRIEIIGALGSIRDYRVIEVLLDILDDDNKKIKIAAAASLAQISGFDFGINSSKWKRWWSNKLKRSNKK